MDKVDSREFAKYLVALAKKQEIPLNFTKLQKLTYICDGVMLAAGNNYINENCCVWDYGPVYPKIYKWYERNWDKRITLDDVKVEDKTFIEENKINELMNKILKAFENTTASQLSAWTHKPGSPWAIAKAHGGMYSKIDKKDISEYFAGININETN